MMVVLFTGYFFNIYFVMNITKKVGKTARPFRYDLNQVSYDYVVELSLMNYGWRLVTLYRTQGSRPSPWNRNAKKQNGCLGRPYK